MWTEANNLQPEHSNPRDIKPGVLIFPCERFEVRGTWVRDVDIAYDLSTEAIQALYPKTDFGDKAPEMLGESQFNFVYYPGSNTLIKIPDKDSYYSTLTSRNRETISIEEQNKLKNLRIGIIGLSVGQSSALTLVQSGIGQHFKLADSDRLALSNLGRIPIGGISDVGRLKTYIAGEAMLEKNPYLEIEYYGEITKENLRPFLEGLDYVVDAFDSIQTKITLRRIAKELGVTVVMGTDIGFGARIDIEKPDDPIFLGTLPPERLSEIENTGYIPQDVKNTIIPQMLGFKRIDELPPRLRRHLQLMNAGDLPWMSQLAIASSQVGALVAKAILDLTIEGGAIERRQKTELTPI